MSALRPPVVAALVRGAGASTVAVALHGVDGGVRPDGVGTDLLVGDLPSLRAVPQLPARAGRGPVLAVRALAGAPAEPATVLAALGPAAYWFRTMVVLPHVPALAAGELPPPLLARLVTCDVARLEGPLRAFVTALREVADALVRSGRLVVGPGTAPARAAFPARLPVRHAAPPAPSAQPITGSSSHGQQPDTSRRDGTRSRQATPGGRGVPALWPGLGPVERPVPAADGLDDLDDLAVEDHREAG